MRFIIELSGEHPSLPMEELRSCAAAVGEQFTIVRKVGRLLIVDSEGLGEMISRCALVRSCSLVCAEDVEPSTSELSHVSEMVQAFISDQRPGARSFRITCRKIGGRHTEVDPDDIIEAVASGLTKDVSLESPDIEILVFITPGLFVGIKTMEADRSNFPKRAVKNRPFFSPISLPPILARTLTNLCRVPPGGTILAPFCGTDGILLEASMLDYRTIGADLDGEMLSGSRKNLEHFDQHADLIRSDVGDLKMKLSEQGIQVVDGIATDLPYGQASTTFGEEPGDLMERAFSAIEEVLVPGGFTAVVTSDPLCIKLYSGTLRLHSCHRLRVHRSLTRYFLVYRKVE